jgi:hypothetical protein
MNNVARILLLAGALILALLVGILIGRGQRNETPAGNMSAVQITTAPPPMAPVAPLPAPVQTPKAAEPPKVAPEQQVQDDAAAVGMTTREPDDQAPATPPAAPAPAPAPDASAGGNGQ